MYTPACSHCGATLAGDDRFCPRCGTPAAAPVAATTDDLNALRDALAPTYQLVRALGAGGMGSVYLAREPALKRTVAVKVLSPELASHPAARARFEREAQAVAGLSHPNVVPVFAVGELPDHTPYFVMQHVTGRSMADRVREGPLPVAQARRIIGEVASALAAAHAKGIIHRDIKPANILYDDASDRALVSDFGIAAVTGPEQAESSTKLTQTGMAIGTPQYMSPEQLLAEPVTEKTDIYALGLLGFELLTGRAPYQETSPQALIAAHLRDTPPLVSDLREDVEPDVAQLIARCLDKNPDQRPGARDVARKLAPGAGTHLEWPPPGLEELHGALPRITRYALWSTVLLLATLLPLFMAGDRLGSAARSAGVLLLLLGLGVGLALLGHVLQRTIQRAGAATWAVRHGFAWGTVLETAADRRGDTGALIVGSRRFASIPVEQRSQLRRMRVVRELGLYVGGISLLPVLWLLIVVTGAVIPEPAVLALAAAPWLAGLVLHGRLEAWEERLAPPASRQRHRGRRADVARLADLWYTTFEAARDGQGMGRGTRARPMLGRAAAWASLGMSVAVVLVLVPVLVVGAVGPLFWDAVVPKFAGTSERVERAMAVSRFRPPIDSSITPIEAGRALARLAAGPPGPIFPEHPREPLPDLPWSRPLPAGLFGGQAGRAHQGPDETIILTLAQRGFSPAEMAYLEEVATSEVWALLRMVARAPSVDGIGGRYITPFPDDVQLANMPILRFGGTKELAYLAPSRAAYFMARGQQDSAEAALRDVIGFGFGLMDGHLLIETLIGAVIVGIGQSSLQQFYDVTSHPLGGELRSAWDSVGRAIDERNALAGTPDIPADGRQYMIDLVRNTAAPRSLRMEMLFGLGWAPCANARELLFGPSRDIREVFAYATSNLARYPSETALMDLMITATERGGVGRFATPLLGRIYQRWTQFSGWMLANPRLATCGRSMTAMGT